jgi:hypothetical protein
MPQPAYASYGVAGVQRSIEDEVDLLPGDLLVGFGF